MIEKISQEENSQEIKLNFGKTEALISKQGAYLRKISFNNQEILFPDGYYQIENQSKRRGGMPVLFPWAGSLEGGKQHGFARDLLWQDLSSHLNSNENEALLFLESNSQTKAVFPYQFRNELHFSLSENGISCQLTVFNQDKKEMPVAPGFHPYFKIPKEKLTSVKTNLKNFGLNDYQFTDTLFFPMKEEIKINLGGNYEIKMKLSGDFLRASKPQIAAWTDDERYFCIEPWSAPLGGFLKDQEKIIIPPGEDRKFIMTLSFTSSS